MSEGDNTWKTSGTDCDKKGKTLINSENILGVPDKTPIYVFKNTIGAGLAGDLYVEGKECKEYMLDSVKKGKDPKTNRYGKPDEIILHKGNEELTIPMRSVSYGDKRHSRDEYSLYYDPSKIKNQYLEDEPGYPRATLSRAEMERFGLVDGGRRKKRNTKKKVGKKSKKSKKSKTARKK